MTLLPVAGHRELQERFRRAAGSGRLPQSLLLRGPPGVGKQRLALWLAGLVLCEAPAERPCGRCTSCRLAADLQHPDIHWFFPLPSPVGVAGDRRRQRLEEARLEELEVRRNQALWPTLEDAGSSIFLPMVEEIRSRAVRRPAMGRSTAFVIGDAERMVSQASSPEAANAFLKLLEEPPTDTLIFLTSSRPGSLLPTIRSRVLEVRVTAPAEDDATRFLAEHAHVELPEAVAAIRQSDGSIGRALELVTGESTGSRTAALRVLECAVRGSRGDRLRVAAGFPSAGARGPFSAMLESLEQMIRDGAAVAAGAPGAAFDPALSDRIPELGSTGPPSFVEAARHVEQARDAAAGNGNPESIAAVLLTELAQVFHDGSSEGA